MYDSNNIFIMSPCFKNYTKNEGMYPNGCYFIEYCPNHGYGLTRWIYNSDNGMWYESCQDLSHRSPDKFVFTGGKVIFL